MPAKVNPIATCRSSPCFLGFIDAHTHFFLEGGELDAEKRTAYLKQTPQKLLDLARAEVGEACTVGNRGLPGCWRQGWRGPGTEQTLRGRGIGR